MNNLGLLAFVKSLPSDKEVEAFSKTDEVKELLIVIIDKQAHTMRQHLKIKDLLNNGRIMDAWKVLLL